MIELQAKENKKDKTDKTDKTDKIDKTREDNIVTSKEFAEIIGVSQSTISRALNNSNQISAERREFIKKKAEEYSFVLNSQARSLKTNRTGTVGILFPKHFVGMSANLGLAYLYDLVQKELSKYDYDVMVVYEGEKKNGLSTFERMIKIGKVDGFIIFRMESSKKDMDLIKKYNVPCVYLLHAEKGGSYGSCLSDCEYSGYLVGKHYGKYKDYKSKYLNVKTSGESKTRLAGFKRGLKECGIDLDNESILQSELSVESAYECIITNQEMIKSSKCAIFAFNDIVAIGVLKACRDLGLKVPEDVQIAGVGGIPICLEIVPELTTVDVFHEKIASMGCEMLRSVINNGTQEPIHTVIRPELVLRRTTLL